jgi:two-component system response regulator QseB
LNLLPLPNFEGYDQFILNEPGFRMEGRVKVLVVEDNLRLAALVCEGLGLRGFTADHAPNLSRAEESLAVTVYNAVVLDLGLPDGDGLAWLRSVQRGRTLPPVLILTARSSLGDRVAGLDGGADDYLVKPFELDELAARLRALLRRPGERLAPVLRVGRLAFDTSTRSANFNGALLDLTRRESDLLDILMRRSGRVVSKASIENAIYHLESDVSANAIEATMSRLRRKLTSVGAGHLLVTRRGDGYMIQPNSR